METNKDEKMTYTLTTSSAKDAPRNFASAEAAARAFHATEADKRPTVVGVQTIDGRESGSYLATTSQITKGNETYYSKWASGIIDPEFQKAYEDCRREQAKTAASVLHLPTNGHITVDDYDVTKINFAKRKGNETARYDLALTVPFQDGVMIKELKNLDRNDMMNAVGETNAETIDNRKSLKGVLKGKELEYAYGLSPEEADKRIEEKEMRKAADMQEIAAMGITGKTLLDEEQEINASVPLGSIPGATARLNQRNALVEVLSDGQVTAFGGRPALEYFACWLAILKMSMKTMAFQKVH